MEKWKKLIKAERKKPWRLTCMEFVKPQPPPITPTRQHLFFLTVYINSFGTANLLGSRSANPLPQNLERSRHSREPLSYQCVAFPLAITTVTEEITRLGTY
jgi:hypothetical protein